MKTKNFLPDELLLKASLLIKALSNKFSEFINFEPEAKIYYDIYNKNTPYTDSRTVDDFGV